MNWFMIAFLAAGAYMVYFGATTIQKMRESLKTGKTKMAGKELLPAALMTVYTESEYCGSTFPICNTGTNFGWCIMSTRNLYSQR